MSTDETIKYAFIGDTSSLRNASKKASDHLKTFEKEASKVFMSLSGLKIGNLFANAVKSSIEMIENVNLFKVALRESKEVGDQFVDTMQEVYGMDPNSIMRDVGTFYQLTSAVNATKEAAETMSMQLTKAANDISSLFNTPIGKVVQDLQSGIRGMSRAVVKYGMDIRATTLQVTASTLGISKQVEKMSEADREGLRYITMMRQAKNAMGDFANTIESPANQLKILKEQMAQFSRAVGNFFLPFKKYLPYINGFIMAIRTMLEYIAVLRGLLNDDSSISFDTSKDSIESMGEALDNVKKKAKDLLAPFDELNVINESASIDSENSLDGLTMDPKIEEAVKALKVDFEDVRMKANEVRDSILSFFGFTEVDGQLKFLKDSFEQNLINRFPGWTNTIQSAFDNWSGIVSGFKAVWEATTKVVKQLAKDIKNAIVKMLGGDDADQKVAQWIASLPEKLQNIADWISEHKEGIAKFIEIFAGFKVASFFVGKLSEKLSGLSKFTAPLTKGIGNSKLFKDLPDSTTLTKDLSGLFDLNKLAGSNDFEALGASLGELGGIIQTSFTGSLKEMSTAVGGATFLKPLLTVGATIAAIVGMLVAAYMTSEDFRNSVHSVFESLGRVLKTLWENVLKPVLGILGPAVKDMWYDSILPILEMAMNLIAEVANLIAWLLPYITELLEPFIEFFATFIAENLKATTQLITNGIRIVLTAVTGLVDIIKKLADGDWKGAWESFKSTSVTILKLIYKNIYSIINGIWEIIKGFINSIGKAVGKIRGWFTDDSSAAWEISAKMPTPDEVFMATGGVVSGPTRATIGEGQYDEAVIPLGDSPQINEMLDKFASKVSDRPLEIKLMIGDREWDAFTYKSSQRGSKIVGATPLGSDFGV